MFDLKFHGSMIFVDAARLFTLATGATATNTRERLLAAGTALKVPVTERDSWGQRFRVCADAAPAHPAETVTADAPGNANLIDIATLNDMDRRMLKESLRVGRRLQQRLELDYRR